jgi:TonB family protein
MALRPMARLDLVGDQRRLNAPIRIDEPKIGESEDEPDIRLTLSRLANTLSAHGEVLLSADLALDLLLNRIVEQARLATNTTGAAIALRRGDDIVCRATSGDTAPDLGVRLNLRSGLSGACVQTREVQSCDDTETDLRVDSIACRQLGVRSILIVPVIKEQELLGVFEVFSPYPNAFGERDVQTLRALSRRAVDSVARSHEAVVPPQLPISQPQVVVVAPSRRDHWMLLLTAVVISLAVLLGWLLGREGWQRTVRNIKTKSAQIKISAPPASTPPLSVPPTSVKAAPVPVPSGGIVVYQYGKVIYPIAKLPAQVAERSVTKRVEPVYPEAARAQRIEGKVLLEATVNQDGSVEELKTISGNPLLVTPAVDAVRQWRFQPLLKTGKPAGFETQIKIDFRLPK